MKSKKILGLLLVVTLLSATVFGTTSVFAAGAQTNVSLESYMPPVKTIFVDDDFENRAVGSEIKSDSAYTNGTTTISGWDNTNKKNVYATVLGDETNKYAKINFGYSDIKPKADRMTALKDAKKLVITLDNKFVAPTDETTFAKYSSQIEIRCVDPSKTTSTLPIVRIEGARKNGTTTNEYYTIKYYKMGSTSATTLAGNIGKYNTDWNKIYLVLSKEYDEATSKYYAYIDKVMIDGITGNPWGESATIDIPEKVPANALRADWWTDGTKPFSIVAASTITDTNEMYFDNVLIYEPYDVYMTGIDAVNKTVKIVNDGSDAVTGNVFIALYDENKNLLAAKEASTELSVPAGGSQTVSLNDETFGHENAKTAKIFFWNKLSLAPLCAAETVPLLP
mgnify:CR=1 FL=1